MVSIAPRVERPWRPIAHPDSPALAAGPTRWAPESIFWMFLAAHVVVWTLLPLLTQANAPLDAIEMVYWGRGWQWGYYKHPPLPAWIAVGLFELSSGAIWPLYLAAQLAVATSLWAAWQLARRYLAPWPAVCAAVVLEGSHFYTSGTIDWNNSIVLQPLWALAVWWLYQAIDRGQVRYWLGTGICLGLGMLAKYDMAILVLSMLALPVVNAQARAALKTIGPYLTLIAALSVFAPHLAWCLQNDFPTIQYALARAHNGRSWFGHVANPVEFFLSQVLTLSPVLALAWPLWRSGARGYLAKADNERFQRDFLLICCLGPLAIDLLISLATGLKLQSMWGLPMWTFIGVLLCALASEAPRHLCQKIILRSAIVGAVALMIMTTYNLGLPYLRGKASRIHFPGPELAQAVESTWRSHCESPLPVVAGPWWIAANAGLNMPTKVAMCEFFDPEHSPWSSASDLDQRGGVIVWQDDAYAQEHCSRVRGRFPDAILVAPLDIEWQTSASLPPARFHVAIVRPAPQREIALSAEAPVERKLRR